jgi:hypothetical protein
MVMEDQNGINKSEAHYNLSIVNGTNPTTTDVRGKTLKEVAEIIISNDWCPGGFLGKGRKETVHGHRSLETFTNIDLLTFDFDEGYPIEAAAEDVKEYRHIITPSKSHRKVKNPGTTSEKPAWDRYRLVMPFNMRLYSPKEFKVFWQYYRDKFGWGKCSKYPLGKVDHVASHAACFFSRSTSIYSFNNSGIFASCFLEDAEIAKYSKQSYEGLERVQPENPDERGQLSNRTMNFINHYDGSIMKWHDERLSALVDIRGQNYGPDEARDLLLAVTGIWDSDDEYQLWDIYSRGPSYCGQFRPKPKPIVKEKPKPKENKTMQQIIAEVAQQFQNGGPNE